MRFNGLLFVIAILASFAGCSRDRKEPSSSAPPEAAEELHSRVQHSTNGDVMVTVDAATQKMIGLQTALVQPAQLNPELKGYGRVLDVSPLASLTAELTTVQAASEVSQAELKRLKTLALQSNASERALQAAEAAAIRDRTQVESTRLRLLASWGHTISESKDLVALVENLGALTSALVEIDLPAGEQIKDPPTGARLLTLAQESTPIDARYLGPAPVVSAMQGRGYLFLVQPNPFHLAPGAAVTGLLTFPGTPKLGVALPREAVVYFNGAAWVYRQAGNEAFERTPVALESPLENGWFVGDRLKPQDKVVVVGGQQLLSEELKGLEIE
jgi:multidrug efflux pump subunit AcrA (membrane-fusion protein)